MCQPPNKMVDTETFGDQPANGPRFFNLDFRYSLLRSAIGGQLFKVGVSFTIDDFRNVIIVLRMITERAFHQIQSQKVDPSLLLQIPFSRGIQTKKTTLPKIHSQKVGALGHGPKVLLPSNPYQNISHGRAPSESKVVAALQQDRWIASDSVWFHDV